jgi:molybdopterin converting factor small subunit
MAGNEIGEKTEMTPPVPIPSAAPIAGSALGCTVELFGTAQLLAKSKTVSLALPPEATLARVLSALAEKLPILVGRVITPEKNRLASGFACNINGLDFVRDPAERINPGDRVLILSADAGG